MTGTSLQAHYPSAPTIPRASVLQRSTYTSTQPLFTSSSSQLFTFIYLLLFFICWFPAPPARGLTDCFVHIYHPEMKVGGSPLSALLRGDGVVEGAVMPPMSPYLRPPVLHLSFQIDSMFHMKRAAECRLPRHNSSVCHNFPISPGCMIDAGQSGVWPRRCC